MDYAEVMEAVAALDWEEKRALHRTLGAVLLRHDAENHDICHAVLKAAEDLLGQDNNTKVRDGRVVLLRKLVCYRLHELGVKDDTIGSTIGRERSTCLFHRRSVADWLAVQKMYRDEIELLNQLREQTNDIH